MMQLPDRLRFECLRTNRPIEGIWFELHALSDEWPNKIPVLVGPTDNKGIVTITGDAVRRKFRQVVVRLSLPIDLLDRWWNGRLDVRLAPAESLRQLVRRTYEPQDDAYGDDVIRRRALIGLCALRALDFAEEDDEPLIRTATEPRDAATIAVLSRVAENWIRDEWTGSVRSILEALTECDLERLIEGQFITLEEADYIASERMDYPATFMTPPDEIFVIASVERTADNAWLVRVPLWTIEEGPSDLEAQVSVVEDDRVRTRLRAVIVE